LELMGFSENHHPGASERSFDSGINDEPSETMPSSSRHVSFPHTSPAAPTEQSPSTASSSKKEKFRNRISHVQTQNLKQREELQKQSRMRPVSSAINVTPQRVGHGDHIFIQSSHPAHVINSRQIFDSNSLQSKASLALRHQMFVPSRGSKTLIIGVGLELPSRHAYDTLFNCVNKLPPAHRKKWDVYIHKPFDYTIRSSLVLYDKYGFVLKGGNLMKRKESNVFEYERRRGKSDTFRLILNKDGRCCVQRVDPDTDRVMQSRKSKTSAFLNRASMALHKVPSSVALQMLGKSPTSQNGGADDDEDVLFVKKDTTEDIEQLRIKIVDPKEIHHMSLVLHFDAPMNLFVSENCPYSRSLKRLNFLTRLMPKLRPYVRVIDAERKVEIMRYYIDDLPKISVALEMNRVPYDPEHEKYVRGDLLLNRRHSVLAGGRGSDEDPRRKRLSSTSKRNRPFLSERRATVVSERGGADSKDLDNKVPNGESGYSKNSPRINVDGVTMRHKRVGENVFVLEQATADSPLTSAVPDLSRIHLRDDADHAQKYESRSADTVFHDEDEEDLSDDEMDEIEEIVVTQDEDESERYSWTVIPLRQEWQYVPKHPIAKEQTLGAFLYHADLNTFGIPGDIPQLPKYWKLTIHEGRSLDHSIAYVVIGSNSIHHTQKHTTKPLRNHRWGESFKCAIERGYRAGGIFLVVMKQRTLRKDSTIGRAHLNFGTIKRPYDLDVNPSITTWIPVMKGLSQHGELKVSLTLIYH